MSLQISISVLLHVSNSRPDEKIFHNYLRPVGIIYFIPPLNNYAGRAATVGIFELVAHVLGVAEIKLGADAWPIRILRINECIAQLRDHLLVVRHTIAVEYSDH